MKDEKSEEIEQDSVTEDMEQDSEVTTDEQPSQTSENEGISDIIDKLSEIAEEDVALHSASTPDNEDVDVEPDSTVLNEGDVILDADGREVEITQVRDEDVPEASDSQTYESESEDYRNWEFDGETLPVKPKRGYTPTEDELEENDDEYGYDYDELPTSPSTPQRAMEQDEDVSTEFDEVTSETLVPLPTSSEISTDEEQTATSTTTVETVADANSKDTETSDEKRKRSKLPIIALSAVILIVLGVFGYFFVTDYLDEKNNTIVPEASASISNESDLMEVCDDFTNVDLDCEASWGFSDEVPRHDIMSQSVSVGEKVPNGTTVSIIYSLGPEQTEFPNFYNTPLKKVEEELFKRNIVIESVEEVSSGLPDGNVVSTSIEAGTIVDNGDNVVIQISNGRVSIPDWVGQTVEQVSADADTLGVEVVFVEEESDGPSGIVLSQTPAAGEVDTSDEITVNISKAVETVEIEIPDVIGSTAEEAQVELAVLGFRHISTVVVQNNAVTETQVTQVVPTVGSLASSETNVVIIVSEPITE